MNSPVITVLAGPNGAGKSFYSDLLNEKDLLRTSPVNIDALESLVDPCRIPNDPMRYEKMLRREISSIFDRICKDAIEKGIDFSYECNLRNDQISCVNQFAVAGYRIHLIYIWLDSIEISKERVDIRVKEGGHLVGEKSITDNFKEGLSNLDESVANNDWDHVLILDNSKTASNEDTLSLLLEMEGGSLSKVSDHFLSSERELWLPKICERICCSKQ